MKQWNMRPDEISETVTARVPVFIGADNRYFNDRFQMVPKNGYTAMVANIVNHKNIRLLLNTNFKEVCEIRSSDFYLFGQKFGGKVIFTGKIDELFDYKFGELPYRSLRLEFETVEKKYYQEKATVNYPSNYDFTRITEFKHIHPKVSNKTVILREYPQEYTRGKNRPYYIVSKKENEELYNKYYEYSKKFNNLILIGRLAEYKYYDMDDVVERALEVFEEKIK